MKKIVAIGASNSRQSINKQLAQWAASQTGAEVKVLDLNDYEMPIYSVDREKENVPQAAYEFKEALAEADGIVISFAEYNGSYTSAFKNIFDWLSRISRPVWMNKPMLLMATSPGGRGGLNVLSIAKATFPYQGGEIAASFCLPSFQQNFSIEKGITNPELNQEFETALAAFNKATDEKLSPVR